MVPCGSRQNMAYCAFFCTLLQLLHKPAFAATPESRTGTAAFKTLFDARRACPEKETPAEEPVFFHNDGEHDDVVYSDRVYSDGVYSDGVYSGGAYTDGVHDDGVKGYADSHFNRRNRLRRGRPRRI